VCCCSSHCRQTRSPHTRVDREVIHFTFNPFSWFYTPSPSHRGEKGTFCFEWCCSWHHELSRWKRGATGGTFRVWCSLSEVIDTNGVAVRTIKSTGGRGEGVRGFRSHYLTQMVFQSNEVNRWKWGGGGEAYLMSSSLSLLRPTSQIS
jgi:hypothetical protein